MFVSLKARPLVSRFDFHIYHLRPGDPREARAGSENFTERSGISRLVLDIGLGPVAAGGGLGVPFAVRGFIFDHLGASRHPLLGRGMFGRGKRRGMGRESLRKCAVDGIGPAAIMLNDFVGDIGHRGTRWLNTAESSTACWNG